MTRAPAHPAVAALRAAALRLPDVEEGIACEGTVLESHTFKTGKKAFLFLRATEARLKLSTSIPEATKRAKQDAARFSVGAQGWVKILLQGSLPTALLARWVAESQRTLAIPSKKKRQRA
jgi:predicted DNA-binding protein (MmcQ/YjbR family)